MVEAAQTHNRVLKVGFNHRHHPGLWQAHELAQGGAIGPLISMRAAYGHGGRPGYDQEWRGDPDLAGGGELHADCEAVLLEAGSQQQYIWGADWYPLGREVGFETLINIRPGQQNFTLELQDPALRAKIETIVRRLLEVA